MKSIKQVQAIFLSLAFILVCTVAFATPQIIPALPEQQIAEVPTTSVTTNSVRYMWLESDSSERREFIDHHNQQLTQEIEKDPSHQALGRWLFKQMNTTTVVQEVHLDPYRSIKLIENGLGKETDVVLSRNDVADETLFSNAKLSGGIRNAILGLSVSPGGLYTNIIVAKDGSTDTMTVFVYDLSARKILPAQIEIAENSLAWLSDKTLLYQTESIEGYSVLGLYDVVAGKTLSLVAGSIEDTHLGFVLYSAGGKYRLHHQTDDSEIILNVDSPSTIVSVDDQNIYLLCRGSHSALGEIRRVSRIVDPANHLSGTGDSLIRITDFSVVAATSVGKNFFLQVRNGAERWIRIFNFDGTPRTELEIPNCCAVTNITWVTSTSINVTLSSAVVKSKTLIYDLDHKSWNSDPKVALMVAGNGVQYESIPTTYASEDGTLIPVRLTKRADLSKNGKNPVLFSSYGGFGKPGYLDPAFDFIRLEFLRRGGIFVGAALRGGNENGPLWHIAALKENKIRTFQDLAAGARFMVESGWTEPAKVISTGTSNGGLTVAASSLLYPHQFGLVIGVAGVMDLIAKDRLDPKSYGWSSEYGSDEDMKELTALKLISPLENVDKRNETNFLLLDGLSDTRVNIAHSLKLAAALEQSTSGSGKVRLLSLRAAGHSLQSSTTRVPLQE